MRRMRLRPANRARWHCVQAKPGLQFYAKMRLEAQGFVTFLPLTLYNPAKNKLPEFRPMFGSYFFVQFNKVEQRWQAIYSTPGVSKLLCTDGSSPASIDDEVIESLQSLNKPVIGKTNNLDAIDPGALVRVTSGPFIDKVGVCSLNLNDRVKLLLQIMGNEVACYFSRNDVEVYYGGKSQT